MERISELILWVEEIKCLVETPEEDLINTQTSIILRDIKVKSFNKG